MFTLQQDNRILELDPLNAGEHNAIGLIYVRLGQYEEALAPHNAPLASQCAKSGVSRSAASFS